MIIYFNAGGKLEVINPEVLRDEKMLVVIADMKYEIPIASIKYIEGYPDE